MIWWMTILLFIAFTVLGELLRPKPKFDAPQPGGLDDFSAPTAQEGRVIPVAWGTVKIAGPNITWWGHLLVQPITKSVKTGLFSSTTITTGYRYFLGIMYALCWGPVDALVGINFDTKGGDLNKMPYNAGSIPGAPHFLNPDESGVQVTTQSDGHLRLHIAEFNLLGGDQAEGGIYGDVDFYLGTQAQVANDYLTKRWGMVAAPAFRGLSYAVLRRVYLGTTTYIKPWAWIIQRTPDSLGLGNGHHKIQSPPIFSGFTGSGNGKIGSLSVGSSPITESFTITATDATHFTVKGPKSGTVGTATVGTPFASTKLNFTISAGTIPFSSGDVFVVGIDGNWDANPMCAIYEVITNKDWGLGLDPSLADLASFQAAAETLYTEKLGISMVVSDAASARDLIDEICRHVDGTIYADVSTGKLKVALARNDYDVSTLLELNPSNVAKESFSYSRGSWGITKNEIKIQYTDRAGGYVQGEEQAQELANQRTLGVIISDTIPFRGLSNAPAAQMIAMRCLKTLSYPLAKVHLQANRQAWNLRPGSVFKLNWTPLGLPILVFRVIRISYGELRGRPAVEIDAVEDIFSVATTAYAPGGGSSWFDPSSLPPAAWVSQQLVEVPYFHVGEERWVMTMATRGDDITLGYEVWTNDGFGYYFVERSTDCTPSGVLDANYPVNTASQDETGFQVDSITDPELLIGIDAARLSQGVNLLVIDNEIMAWRDWTPDSVDPTKGVIKGIIRGALDTVPAAHSAGARVWFYTLGVDRTRTTAYDLDQTVKAKLVQYSSQNHADLTTSTELVLATTSRAWKPYPAGNVQVNGLSYPTTTISDAVLTWAYRNRVKQVGVVKQSDASDPNGPEGNYTVEVYVNGVLKRSFSSLSGTSQSYTCAQRTSDSTDGTQTVTMKIRPINGSYEGTAQVTQPFTMTGLGMTMGLYLGGIQA